MDGGLVDRVRCSLAMSVVPRVVISNEALGEWDGFEIVLLGVEVWPRDVVVRLALGWNDRAEKLDAEYSRAMKDWWQLRTSVADGEELPSREAATPPELLGRFVVELADDIGTTYKWEMGSGAGWTGKRGYRWQQESEFMPSPPPGATRLDFKIVFPDGEVRTISADLTTQAHPARSHQQIPTRGDG